MEVKVEEESVRRVRRTQKHKKKKNKLKIIIVLAIIFIVIIEFFVLRNKKKNDFYTTDKKVVKTLVGKWTTDGNTVYEFNDDGKGALVVPVMTVPFSYRIDDNIIYIDFENEDSEDTNYNYTLEDDKLVLNSANGSFEFSRVEE